VVEVEVKGLPIKDRRLPLEGRAGAMAQASLLAIERRPGRSGRWSERGLRQVPVQQDRTGLRQPGLPFKPIITAALDRDYTPATIVIDSPIVFEETRDEDLENRPQKTVGPNGEEDAEDEQKWRPRNYDDEQFNGPRPSGALPNRGT
jgi:penicillin-binding protein 1A